MLRRCVLVIAMSMLTMTVTGLGDWKSQLVKKAVGEAARAGIGNAVEDAARDVAFDAALGAVSDRIPQVRGDVGDAVLGTEVGSAASAGIGAAMTAADVASTMDTALDAAEAAKKANKALKAIRKIR